ncbi:MAG: ATP-binding protein [Gemmataceae bacterium]
MIPDQVKDIPFPQEVVIASDLQEAHNVQQEILDVLARHQFTERDLFAVKLALEEALVNAIKHGNRFQRHKKVHVSYLVMDDVFFVRIRDEGEGFNPDEVPDPTVPENLERPCGRGLMLMRHYMHAVHFLDKGNILVMCRRRNGSR